MDSGRNFLYIGGKAVATLWVGLDGGYDVFGTGADAELAAPDAETAADVVAGMAAAVLAEGTLVDGIGNPRDGPYLAVVGMAAELEIDTGLFGLFKVVGLVVEDDGIERRRLLAGCFHHLSQRLATQVGTVVTPDDHQVADGGSGIPKQVDAGIAIELQGIGLAAVVLVVAQAGIDRRLQTVELLMHAFFAEGPHAHIDDVATDKDDVGLFAVDKVDPSGQFLTGIVVADVQVAGHDNLQGTRQGLRGGEGQRLAVLMAIVDVAIEERSHHEHRDGSHSPPVVVEDVVH